MGRPWVIICQTVFWVWLKGDVMVNVCLIANQPLCCKHIIIYFYLKMLLLKALTNVFFKR
jgi:hypothetical protein